MSKSHQSRLQDTLNAFDKIGQDALAYLGIFDLVTKLCLLKIS